MPVSPGIRCSQSTLVCASQTTKMPRAATVSPAARRIVASLAAAPPGAGEDGDQERRQQNGADQARVTEGLQLDAVRLVNVLVCAPFEEIGAIEVAGADPVEGMVGELVPGDPPVVVAVASPRGKSRASVGGFQFGEGVVLIGDPADGIVDGDHGGDHGDRADRRQRRRGDAGQVGGHSPGAPAQRSRGPTGEPPEHTRRSGNEQGALRRPPYRVLRGSKVVGRQGPGDVGQRTPCQGQAGQQRQHDPGAAIAAGDQQEQEEGRGGEGEHRPPRVGEEHQRGQQARAGRRRRPPPRASWSAQRGRRAARGRAGRTRRDR